MKNQLFNTALKAFDFVQSVAPATRAIHFTQFVNSFFFPLAFRRRRLA